MQCSEGGSKLDWDINWQADHIMTVCAVVQEGENIMKGCVN